MDSQRLIIFFGIVMLLFGIVGCAESAPPPTVALVTPTAGTSTGAISSPLPKSLRDVEQTEVFRFRVDPAQTTVEYAVHEVLLGNDQITRGRTNAVEGEFQLYMQNGKVYIALSNLQVDLRTLTSDNAVRDAAIRKNWLESEKYPKAIFVANDVQGLPADASQDNTYQFRVTGDMTIRNITNPVTFDITARIKDNQLVGEGTATIYMKDYGFDPPSVVGKTIVSDPVTISVKGVAHLIEG